jgi:hypothetical protein
VAIFESFQPGNEEKIVTDVLGRRADGSPSTVHAKLFVKFQSAVAVDMPLILEAFPTTPWLFVHREPLQVDGRRPRGMRPERCRAR